MQKSIKKLMPSKIDFWSDFGGLLERKWKHVGTNIDEKSIQIAKSDFLINRALAAAGAWFLRFQGSKLGAKAHQKTIKKRSQHGKASWHRFLMDFGGFWEASWEGKSSQEPSKRTSKNDEKMYAVKMSQKRPQWDFLRVEFPETRSAGGALKPPWGG